MPSVALSVSEAASAAMLTLMSSSSSMVAVSMLSPVARAAALPPPLATVTMPVSMTSSMVSSASFRLSRFSARSALALVWPAATVNDAAAGSV